MSRLTPAGLALALLASPTSAWACSVCFSATDENRAAYLNTTIFLSLFPLALIGGMGLFIWWNIRSNDVAS